MVLFAQVAVEEELPVDTDGGDEGDEGVRRQFGNVEGVSFPDELRSVIIGKTSNLSGCGGGGIKRERARGGMDELELENFILQGL